MVHPIPLGRADSVGAFSASRCSLLASLRSLVSLAELCLAVPISGSDRKVSLKRLIERDGAFPTDRKVGMDLSWYISPRKDSIQSRSPGNGGFGLRQGSVVPEMLS